MVRTETTLWSNPNGAEGWLPGDDRGFRSRGHRLHSSGDYKNPPKEDTLGYENTTRIAQDLIVIPEHFAERIGRAIVGKLMNLDLRVVVISVSGQHVHFLAELPIDIRTTKQLVGQVKGGCVSCCFSRNAGSSLVGRRRLQPSGINNISTMFCVRAISATGAWVRRTNKTSRKRDHPSRERSPGRLKVQDAGENPSSRRMMNRATESDWDGKLTVLARTNIRGWSPRLGCMGRKSIATG